MKQLTMLVDMDDTLENLCEIWVSYLNELHGTSVTLSDVTEWDMTKAFPMLSRDEIFGVLSDEKLWERVTPLPGAVENLKKIIDDGHKVVVVTTSSPDTVSIKLNKVLFKYFPYLTYNDVIVTSQKQLIDGDIMVDDAPHNLEGGKYFKILFNASHNESYDTQQHGMVRAADWLEVATIIHWYVECTQLVEELITMRKEKRYEGD